jgi:hypothetical protein
VIISSAAYMTGQRRTTGRLYLLGEFSHPQSHHNIKVHANFMIPYIVIFECNGFIGNNALITLIINYDFRFDTTVIFFQFYQENLLVLFETRDSRPEASSQSLLSGFVYILKSRKPLALVNTNILWKSLLCAIQFKNQSFMSTSYRKTTRY